MLPNCVCKLCKILPQNKNGIEEVAATGWGDEFDDDHTPTTKIIVPEQDDETDSSEPEWENPFATKHGGHDEEEEELPYPKFKREVEKILANEVAYPTESSTSVYNPPEDSVMGPPVYPPSAGNYQQYDGLPPAYAGTRALLVLPEDPGLWDDTISRWETITINVLNSQSWADNKSKLLYVENLL
ncbi:hypothetical protein Tco_0191874 [Tanacetum coccineum]